MGYYHTKIHSCITVHDEPDYLHGRMFRQTLTKLEEGELAASAWGGDLANATDEMVQPSLRDCA